MTDARRKSCVQACTIVSGTMLLGFGAAVPAQERKDESNVDKLLDVITVTARKKEENLQDTPVSVSAFSGESLAVRGIEDIGEIETITPNLTYKNNPAVGGASQVASAYIRGVGQRDFLGTIDNGVGFYIDDVYIPRTVGAVVDLLNVDRVEVLRGPQGTLFGRNSVGGAVKIHSRVPGAELGGFFDASYGTDDFYSVKAKLDLPLSDTLLTSSSFLSKRQDGYVARPATDNALGDEKVAAGRFQALWTPSDRFAVSLTGDIAKAEENGPAFALQDAGLNAPRGFGAFYNNSTVGAACRFPGGITSTNPLCYNNANYARDDEDGDSINLGTAPTFSDIEHWGVRLGVDWELNDSFQIKSITSYRDLDAQFARDADASPLAVVHFFDDFRSESFSQELQLVGNLADGRWDFILGAYYFDEDGFNFNDLEFAIAKLESRNKFGTESLALFLQTTFSLTDRLHLTGGIRWTEEEKTFDPDQIVGPNNIRIAAGARILPAGEVSRTDDAVTPMASIAYDVQDNLMIYASYSEGFRSGGFVQRVFPPLAIVPNFGPEFAQSYEGGFKFSTDGMQLSGAVYRVDYTDIQVRTENPGFVGLFEANVGDAKISGFELETRWSPADRWFFEASAGYTDARYTAIRVKPPLRALLSTDSKFDNVPEWSASASLLKDFDLGAKGDLSARLSADYHSGYENNPENVNAIATPERTLLNVNLGWTHPTTGWSLDLTVKNLTDNTDILSGYANPSIGTRDIIRNRGRQFFVGAKYEF